MAKKKLHVWRIVEIRKKGSYVGSVEAATADEAIKIAIECFSYACFAPSRDSHSCGFLTTTVEGDFCMGSTRQQRRRRLGYEAICGSRDRRLRKHEPRLPGRGSF